MANHKVISCPSLEIFNFFCQSYHVISIDSLKFSPVSKSPKGECMSDWSAECGDVDYALDYLKAECSGKESCTLVANQLRTKTKCAQTQVISVSYRCVPTWEVIDVPIKCDLCKNVTFSSTSQAPNFGFVHSAWYTKLDSKTTCHSTIINKPNHIVVIYAIRGSIGLDKILVETFNEFGVVVNKILTGNLTTNLIITSEFNVNITILPQVVNIYQPNFLFYYYVVPKCDYFVCTEETIATTVFTSSISTLATTKPAELTYLSVASSKTTPNLQSTFAPPLKADRNKNSASSISGKEKF